MSRETSIKVVFAGGGTGGHVYPAIAMYEALLDVSNVEALFVGVSGGMEEQIIGSRGWPLETLPGRGVRRASLFTKLSTPVTTARAVSGGLRLLARFQPDVVVGTGGFASAAMVLAAWLRRTPRLLQEQNAVPGMTNRWLSLVANRVLLSYQGSEKWLKGSPGTVVIGNPLRKIAKQSREVAAGELGLDPARPTVLVMGGSRGATKVNEAVANAIPKVLAEFDSQFLILAGNNNASNVAKQTADHADRVKVLAYSENMDSVYAASDVAVARAGASSVFEIAARALPTVFVPYPYAADDHQQKNVDPLVADGAAFCIRDQEITGENLSALLLEILRSPEQRQQMADRLRAWARPDAAQRAASEILNLIGRQPIAAAVV